MKKFFRGRFSGEFFRKFSVFFQGIRQTIQPRQQAQSPATMPRHPLRDYTHTLAHMNGSTRHPAPAAGQPNRQHRNSSTRQHQTQPIRAGESRAFSQVAADHAGKAGAESYTRTRTPTSRPAQHQRRQQTHPPASPTGKGGHPSPGNIPPRGPQCREEYRAKHPAKAKRTPAQAMPDRRRFNTQRTHAGIKTPAPAREKVLRARYFYLAGRCAQNFGRFGAKKPLPLAQGNAMEGGQKSDRGRKLGCGGT